MKPSALVGAMGLYNTVEWPRDVVADGIAWLFYRSGGQFVATVDGRRIGVSFASIPAEPFPREGDSCFSLAYSNEPWFEYDHVDTSEVEDVPVRAAIESLARELDRIGRTLVPPANR